MGAQADLKAIIDKTAQNALLLAQEKHAASGIRALGDVDYKLQHDLRFYRDFTVQQCEDERLHLLTDNLEYAWDLTWGDTVQLNNKPQNLHKLDGSVAYLTDQFTNKVTLLRAQAFVQPELAIV